MVIELRRQRGRADVHRGAVAREQGLPDKRRQLAVCADLPQLRRPMQRHLRVSGHTGQAGKPPAPQKIIAQKGFLLFLRLGQAAGRLHAALAAAAVSAAGRRPIRRLHRVPKTGSGLHAVRFRPPVRIVQSQLRHLHPPR